LGYIYCVEILNILTLLCVIDYNSLFCLLPIIVKFDPKPAPSFLPPVGGVAKQGGGAGNIPWKITSTSLKSHKKIIKMIKWVEDPKNESVIKDFIKENCSAFLIPSSPELPFFGKPDTGHSIQSFDLKSLIEKGQIVDCGDKLFLKTTSEKFDPQKT
jgi:hypothetical protein